MVEMCELSGVNATLFFKGQEDLSKFMGSDKLHKGSEIIIQSVISVPWNWIDQRLISSRQTSCRNLPSGWLCALCIQSLQLPVVCLTKIYHHYFVKKKEGKSAGNLFYFRIMMNVAVRNICSNYSNKICNQCLWALYLFVCSVWFVCINIYLYQI